MGIRQKLWNWCPKPKKRVLTIFTNFTTSMYILIIISAFAITAYATVALSASMAVFTPHPWSLYPPPSEEVTVGVYMNETGEFIQVGHSYTGTIQARKFQVIINSFSKELTLLTDRIYEETYSDPGEGRPVSWSANFLAPNKPGKYEINLRYIVFQDLVGLSKREYKQRVTVVVEPIPYKPKPEELLSVILDKETYYQGATIIITIKNISNETQLFSLSIERFDPHFSDWVYHAALIADSINPEESMQVTRELNAEMFPPGRYRIFIKGFYTEFEVKPKEK
jgi:hypothetical protein